MQHLSIEEIARLVDESPDAREAEHLAGCKRCAAELAALERQKSDLAGLPNPSAPPLWSAIESALEVEGILTRPRTSFPPATAWRIAAGIALFLAGGAVGTFVVAPAIDADAATVTATGQAVAADAATALAIAEADYLSALAMYAELAERGDGLDPLNRLAALEGIVLTTRAALHQAPADPVINNYHLTAVGHRDALLRQLERVMATDEWF